MKVLITGASGFVGGNVSLSLAGDFEICAHYNHHEPEARVRDCAQILQADLGVATACKALVDECERLDCIVHCAGIASPVACEAEPQAAHRSIVDSTRYLIEAASGIQPLPLLLLCSTDLVFEGSSPAPGGFREESTTAPRSVYAHAKLEAERLLRSYSGPSSTLRLSLVYGPKVNGKQGFLAWIDERLAAGRPCDLFIDEFRSPTASADIAATLRALLQRHAEQREIPSLLHLGGSERVSRLEFGQIYCRYLGRSEDLLIGIGRDSFPSSPPRPHDVSLQSRFLESLLGRKAFTVMEGLTASL